MLTFGSRLRSAFGFPSQSRPRSECECSHSGRGWDLHSAFVVDLPSLLAYTLALWDLITNGPKTLETLHPLDVWEFVAIASSRKEQIVVLFHSVHQEVFLFSSFLFTGGLLKIPPGMEVQVSPEAFGSSGRSLVSRNPSGGHQEALQGALRGTEEGPRTFREPQRSSGGTWGSLEVLGGSWRAQRS